MRRGGPNPEAARAFFDTVALSQNEWGSHGIPRASSIGDDLRKQWFSLMYARQSVLRKGGADRDAGGQTLLPSPEPIEGEALWGMKEGNRQEEPIYEVLRRQGYMVHSIQGGAVRYLDGEGKTQVKIVQDDERMGQVVAALKRTGQKPFLTCHIDGIIEGGPDELPPTLLELKKATMFSFGGMVQHGVMTDKPTYRLQITVNAGSFGLDMGRFMIFTRDKSATSWYFTKMRSANPILANPAVYVEDVQIDPRFLKIADWRALHLLKCVEENKMPDPDPGIWPLNVKVEKNGERSHLFPCGWCEWKEPCLQHLRESGVNINDYRVVEDLRGKAERERNPL